MFNLKKTLDSQSLNFAHEISSNMGLYFHWSDCKKSVEYIKNQIDNNTQLQLDYEKLNKGAEFLASVEIWSRNYSKVNSFKLIQLYEDIITNNVLSFDYNSIKEISLVGPFGPFKKMTLAECLGEVPYQEMIYLNIIKSKIRSREFRIRTSSNVLYKDFENNQSGVLCLSQMSESGFLFSSTVENPKGIHNKPFRIYLNLENVHKAINMKEQFVAKDLFFTNNKLKNIVVDPVKIKKSNKFNYEITKTKFYFVPWTSIQEKSFRAMGQELVAEIKHELLSNVA